MKPFTYIVVHTLADFFGIHLRHTNFIAEADDATSIEALIESVKGYVSTEDDAKRDGVREEKRTPTGILRRAWNRSQKPNKKWMIHKGLDGLGFFHKRSTKCRLDLNDNAGTRLQFPLLPEEVRESFQWQKAFNDQYIEEMRARCREVHIWQSLKALLQPAIWRADGTPEECLNTLADFHEADPGAFLREWVHLKTRVKENLGARGDLTSETFRKLYLLPALSQRRVNQRPESDNTLTRLLIVGMLTVCNSAQLNRDMKSFEDMWTEDTRKLAASERVGAQCMLHLNGRHRSIDDFLTGSFRIYSDPTRKQLLRKRKRRSGEGEPRDTARKKTTFCNTSRTRFRPHADDRSPSRSDDSCSDAEGPEPCRITDAILDS